MLVVKNGKVCAMAWDTIKRRWVYIPVKRWAQFTTAQKERYTSGQELQPAT